MTSQDVYNIKMKVEGLIPHMNECYDYKAFQEIMNKHGSGSNHLHADNKIVSSDETCQMSTSVWKEIMNNFINVIFNLKIISFNLLGFRG